jgi:CRP-like cAMP-binding protein
MVIFKNHLQKFIDVSDSDFENILRFTDTRTVKKKENLLSEGQLCRQQYFVLKGCLRKFFINDKGIEQTTEFAIENWWMTDNIAFEHKQPTQFFIQAVEPSQVLSIHHTSWEQMMIAVPKMERYFRFVYQRAYAAAQMRIKYLYDFSKEEMYDHFSAHYPQFVQRIPQHLLASFLGFTPEYLSEIRKKARS